MNKSQEVREAMERPDAATVLVVDDDELMRKALDLYLSRRGYRVIGAGNGAEALQKATEEQPDVILLDIALPVLDGWEVCRRVRETSRVPIIVLTARSQEADRAKGQALGATDYLAKPYPLSDLAARIQAVLR